MTRGSVWRRRPQLSLAPVSLAESSPAGEEEGEEGETWEGQDAWEAWEAWVEEAWEGEMEGELATHPQS